MADRHVALLVEDDFEMAAALGERLAAIGHDYIHAPTQQEALALIERGGFCYVLLDLQIKRHGDALEALVEAGQHLIHVLRERYPQRNARNRDHLVPIIVVSGHAKESDYIVRALKDGADDFARKPLGENKRMLTTMIDEVLRESGRVHHRDCAAITKAALGRAAPASSGTGIAVTAKPVGRRTLARIGMDEVKLTDAGLVTLLQLIDGALRNDEGWVHKDGFGDADGPHAVLRLKECLPEAIRDTLIENRCGHYRLRPPVTVEQVDVGLGVHDDHRVRRLVAAVAPLLVDAASGMNPGEARRSPQ